MMMVIGLQLGSNFEWVGRGARDAECVSKGCVEPETTSITRGVGSNLGDKPALPTSFDGEAATTRHRTSESVEACISYDTDERRKQILSGKQACTLYSVYFLDAPFVKLRRP